jgi:two-component system, chemotaxis family, chemotaxis protein CheY
MKVNIILHFCVQNCRVIYKDKLMASQMPVKKILVVDDSETLRAILIFVLEEAGYQVLVGIDGIDAQKHLNNQPIDLIITDLHMPNLDGIGFIKVVRNHPFYANTPILFLTTDTQLNRKSEAKDAGATGWIIKPFDQDKLISAVGKVIK